MPSQRTAKAITDYNWMARCGSWTPAPTFVKLCVKKQPDRCIQQEEMACVDIGRMLVPTWKTAADLCQHCSVTASAASPRPWQRQNVANRTRLPEWFAMDVRPGEVTSKSNQTVYIRSFDQSSCADKAREDKKLEAKPPFSGGYTCTRHSTHRVDRSPLFRRPLRPLRPH